MKRDKLNVGIIGYGSRGLGLLESVILALEKVNVTAVCDSYEDRAEQAAETVERVQGKRPDVTIIKK